MPSHLLYEDREVRSGYDLVTSNLRAKVQRLAKAAANAMHDLKRILTIFVDMATELSLSVILLWSNHRFHDMDYTKLLF